MATSIVVTDSVQPAAAAAGQSRRVIFIDLARALAAVFMLYGHTVAALLDPRYQSGTWFEIWVFQRGLTSSLFLLLSGFAFSIATTKHWASHGFLSPAFFRRTRRFGLFILLGYALHFPVERFADLSTASDERWRSFLAVDVLQLIGVTFVIVQLLVSATRTRRAFTITVLALAVAMIAATPWIWSRDVSGLAPSVAAYLSPSVGSQFPLFPWAGFILAGAALGQLYAAWGAGTIHRYSNRALITPGAALLVVAFVLRAVSESRAAGPGWEAVPAQVTLRMGASLIVLAIIAHASHRVVRLPRMFGAVAQETLLIYFVHLCIVYGSIWNTGLAQMLGATLGPFETLAYVLILMGAMVLLAAVWNRLKHARPRLARWVAIGAGGLLIYRLL
jgi:uncharacterized membrane protein